MTRQEKIEHIAGLIDINVPKQDITDYRLSDEELHIRILKKLAKCTDSDLDEIIDKVWEVISKLQENMPLPELNIGE